jgi:arabinan endo-1,5-alpha-L-arabinosidase
MRIQTKISCLLACLVSSLGAARAQEAVPTFADVTVHDPSVIKVGERWYVYGSHGASAWTEDLMRWTQVATGVNAGSPAHFNTFQSELSELIGWTAADTLWAADVAQLPDGKFYYYYNVWTNLQSYRSYMGLAVADGIEGPFTDVGEIMRGGTGVAGFNPSVHPNTIDPQVFFDQSGQSWMVYGSYSGGIFILRLDQTIGSPNFGRPLPGQGWGTKLIGGNHAQIEGPYIVYSPESEYYYLFVSYGGLAANGGYNMRVFRSRAADGPYLDAAGNDMSTTPIANNLWPTIAPYGVKLMGNFQFQTVAGETGSAMPGYVSPGHNSAYYDPTTDQYFLIFHTRFVGQGEFHRVRVHQMFVNAEDWLVVAPHRYAGETIAPMDAGRIVGTYKLINHGKDITPTVKLSTTVTLAADGSVTGAASGSWQLTGDYDATVVLDGVTYRGVFVRQWDEGRVRWVTTFTALDGATGTQVWGSKVAIDTAPAFVTQPAPTTTVGAGEAVTFTAVASGDPAPSYQWRKNGEPIQGATSAAFTIAKTRSADAGDYSVVVTNSVGSAVSAVAALDVQVPPTISTHPASVTQPAGTATTLAVTGTGSGELSYQWHKDGVAIPGAISATLEFVSLQASDAGDYTVTVSDSVAATVSRPARIVVATPVPGRIANFSVRSVAGMDGRPLIVGFVVSGSSKDLLVRGIGPELSEFGVTGAMSDPAMAVWAKVNDVDTVVAQNDDWGSAGGAAVLAPVFDAVGAFELLDPASKDSALLATVDGARTAHVNGTSAGIVLVECYDTAVEQGARLVNLSARNFAGTDDRTLIAGFVVSGNVPKRMLVRGIGPTLAEYEVPGVLADPRVAIYAKVGDQDVIVASNDDWSDEPGAAAAIAAAGAFPLQSGSLDAALVVTLPAGVYTAHVSGVGGTTGEALVEVYELP